MNFKTDVVIGTEVHVELDTKTKLFCGCPSTANEPNTATCVVCLGMPGSKPVLNKKAVDYALRLCLALNCDISKELIFSRKSYFYPDMAKNYQITQYELPLGQNGKVELSDGKIVGVTRVHMEEDPAALIHPAGMTGSSYVLVDYNRSGRPLCEVVTEPDMTSPEQARDFMKQLISVLCYIKIFDVNKCIIKADANVSIKEAGYVKVEVKNITGFKEIEKALAYEIKRQRAAVKNKEEIVQETRMWDSENAVTISVRKKETAEDYGYILDPDLVVTDIGKDWISKVKDELPELHRERAKRYVKELKISSEDAKVLTLDYELSEFFDAVAKKVDAVLAARWVRRELVRVLNYNKVELSEAKFGVKEFVDILELLSKDKITDNVAKKILEQLVNKNFDVKAYVKSKGLEAVSDTGALEGVVKKVLSEYKEVVDEYKAGKNASLNFLVGQVMRATRGAANAGEVIKMINKLVG